MHNENGEKLRVFGADIFQKTCYWKGKTSLGLSTSHFIRTYFKKVQMFAFDKWAKGYFKIDGWLP